MPVPETVVFGGSNLRPLSPLGRGFEELVKYTPPLAGDIHASSTPDSDALADPAGFYAKDGSVLLRRT